MPALLVFGARNLGRVLARELAADGWRVAAVARTGETIERLREEVPGAVGLTGDASDPGDVGSIVMSAYPHGLEDPVSGSFSPQAPSRPGEPTTGISIRSCCVGCTISAKRAVQGFADGFVGRVGSTRSGSCGSGDCWFCDCWFCAYSGSR